MTQKKGTGKKFSLRPMRPLDSSAFLGCPLFSQHRKNLHEIQKNHMILYGKKINMDAHHMPGNPGDLFTPLLPC